ncbi:MAG TPA: hypothetical protein VGV67_01100 [Solirubrobacteraceae bacterium]|nr:hypothetical protein [Solirubrobacteraceae bacterium]
MPTGTFEIGPRTAPRVEIRPERELARLTPIDHRDHEALAAVAEGATRLLAHVDARRAAR